VTFTDPEVGSVGLTEQQAGERLAWVLVGSTNVPSTSRGWIHKVGNEGLIKLIADADRGVLVGATAIGPAGGEVLGALSVAVHAQVPLHTPAVDNLRPPDLPPRHRRRPARTVVTHQD